MTVLLLCAVMLCGAQAAPVAGADGASAVGGIAGVVLRSGSTEPLPRARVLVTPADGVNEPATLARTDGTGRFAVPVLPAGRYRIVVDREGYVRSASVVAVTAGGSTPARIALTPTGVITGRVVDAEGTPVARTIVRASTGTASFEGQTNDLGEYRIWDLPPGRYVVSGAPYLPPRIDGTMLIRPSPPSPYARGEGQAMLPLLRMVQAGDYIDPMALTREVYLPVYYPGTTDATRAAALDLAAGSTLTGIDLTVVRAPASPPK
jgi:hypothetical protein